MSTSGDKRSALCNADHSNEKLAAFYLGLMEEFLHFCKNKIGKAEHPHMNLNAGQSIAHNFKEKVNMYFGKHLPSDVIDELCKLVAENSYGKCHFCILPTESLVLSVLQILLDASNKVSKKGDGNLSAKSACFSVNIEKDTPTMKNPSAAREDHLQSDGMLSHSSREQCHGKGGIKFQHIGEDTILSNDSDGEYEEAMCPRIECIHNLGAKADPIIDAPLLMNVTKVPCKKRPRQHGPINPPGRKEVVKGGIHPYSKFSPDVQVIGTSDVQVIGTSELSNKRPYPGITLEKLSPEVKVVGTLEFNKRCSDLGKVTDQMYNKRFLSKSALDEANSKVVLHDSQEAQVKRAAPVIQNAHPPKAFSSCRFALSDEELHYYNIICGLAHSDLRTTIGVQFFKTSVTFQSLGESVEPQGHADNYFIAAFCRKYFEDCHPRHSKKHYFYPRIGASLLSYKSSVDVKIVKNSFVGANSAYKLHLSHKLCFPIHYGNHWFVFIVDMGNKIFAFLDSYYDQNDMYQIQVRDRLVTSFKECFYEHADVKTDLEHFEVLYPPTPKQRNPHDCGIFSVMFMEMWDASVDLREVFDFADIPNIRAKLANSLFFSSTNAVDKSIVNGFYDQVFDPRHLK